MDHHRSLDCDGVVRLIIREINRRYRFAIIGNAARFDENISRLKQNSHALTPSH